MQQPKPKTRVQRLIEAGEEITNKSERAKNLAEASRFTQSLSTEFKPHQGKLMTEYKDLSGVSAAQNNIYAETDQAQILQDLDDMQGGWENTKDFGKKFSKGFVDGAVSSFGGWSDSSEAIKTATTGKYVESSFQNWWKNTDLGAWAKNMDGLDTYGDSLWDGSLFAKRGQMIGYTAGIAAEGALEGAVLGGVAGMAFKGAALVSKANMAKNLVVGTHGAIKGFQEAYMNATETHDQVYNELLNKGFSAEVANAEAAKAAGKHMRSEAGLLAALGVAQNLLVHGSFNASKTVDALSKVTTKKGFSMGISDAAERTMTGLAEKLFPNMGKTAAKASGFMTNSLAEGVEETVQTWLGTKAFNDSMESLGLKHLKKDYLSGETGEAFLMGAFGGAVMSGVGKGVGRILNGKALKLHEKTREDFLKSTIESTVERQEKQKKILRQIEELNLERNKEGVTKEEGAKITAKQMGLAQEYNKITQDFAFVMVKDAINLDYHRGEGPIMYDSYVGKLQEELDAIQNNNQEKQIELGLSKEDENGEIVEVSEGLHKNIKDNHQKYLDQAEELKVALVDSLQNVTSNFNAALRIAYDQIGVNSIKKKQQNLDRESEAVYASNSYQDAYTPTELEVVRKLDRIKAEELLLKEFENKKVKTKEEESEIGFLKDSISRLKQEVDNIGVIPSAAGDLAVSVSGKPLTPGQEAALLKARANFEYTFATSKLKHKKTRAGVSKLLSEILADSQQIRRQKDSVKETIFDRIKKYKQDRKSRRMATLSGQDTSEIPTPMLKGKSRAEQEEEFKVLVEQDNKDWFKKFGNLYIKEKELLLMTRDELENWYVATMYKSDLAVRERAANDGQLVSPLFNKLENFYQKALDNLEKLEEEELAQQIAEEEYTILNEVQEPISIAEIEKTIKKGKGYERKLKRAIAKAVAEQELQARLKKESYEKQKQEALKKEEGQNLQKEETEVEEEAPATEPGEEQSIEEKTAKQYVENIGNTLTEQAFELETRLPSASKFFPPVDSTTMEEKTLPFVSSFSFEGTFPTATGTIENAQSFFSSSENNPFASFVRLPGTPQLPAEEVVQAYMSEVTEKLIRKYGSTGVTFKNFLKGIIEVDGKQLADQHFPVLLEMWNETMQEKVNLEEAKEIYYSTFEQLSSITSIFPTATLRNTSEQPEPQQETIEKEIEEDQELLRFTEKEVEENTSTLIDTTLKIATSTLTKEKVDGKMKPTTHVVNKESYNFLNPNITGVGKVFSVVIDEDFPIDKITKWVYNPETKTFSTKKVNIEELSVGSQEWLEVIPMKYVDSEGNTIGYVHTPSYYNKQNVANLDTIGASAIENINSLRAAAYEASKKGENIQVEVTHRSRGILNNTYHISPNSEQFNESFSLAEAAGSIEEVKIVIPTDVPGEVFSESGQKARAESIYGEFTMPMAANGEQEILLTPGQVYEIRNIPGQKPLLLHVNKNPIHRNAEEVEESCKKVILSSMFINNLQLDSSSNSTNPILIRLAKELGFETVEEALPFVNNLAKEFKDSMQISLKTGVGEYLKFFYTSVASMGDLENKYPGMKPGEMELVFLSNTQNGKESSSIRVAFKTDDLPLKKDAGGYLQLGPNSTLTTGKVSTTTALEHSLKTMNRLFSGTAETPPLIRVAKTNVKAKNLGSNLLVVTGNNTTTLAPYKNFMAENLLSSTVKSTNVGSILNPVYTPEVSPIVKLKRIEGKTTPAQEKREVIKETITHGVVNIKEVERISKEEAAKIIPLEGGKKEQSKEKKVAENKVKSMTAETIFDTFEDIREYLFAEILEDLEEKGEIIKEC